MARWQVVVVVARERHPDITLRFDRTPITIGGSAASDVVLAGPHVSRTHAVITVSGGRVVYQDRSSNGSFVDNHRVTEVALGPDDVVVVPPYAIRFSLEGEQDQPTAPLPGPDLPLLPAHVVAEEPALVGAGSRAIAGPGSFTLRLVQAPGPLLDRTFTFERRAVGDEIIVGRAADADVCLDIPSVSRQHAAITPAADGQWRVSDRGSRNGIAINGATTPGGVLAVGDRITFGPDVTAVFSQPPGAPPPAAAESASVVPQPPPAASEDLRLTERAAALDDRVVVVSVEGRIDGYNYTEFRDRLHRMIDAGQRLLVLNFAGCVFCDHVGLSVVLSVKTTLDKHRGRLCLIGVSDRMHQGLTLLRLDTLLAIEPDEDAAVARLVK
jgi:anti-anti-sigma factor